MLSRSKIAEKVRQWAEQAGFELSGIVTIPQAGFPELDHFPGWIQAGHAGEMDYLKARNEHGELKRAAIGNFAPWARSVIVCAINYNTAKPYSTELRDPLRGWISRYAWAGEPEKNKATDYHDAVLVRLRRMEVLLHQHATELGSEPIQSRCYVDTGPLVERVYAKYAGLGWLAKNTCLINQTHGSWLFLGTIITSLELHEDGGNGALAVPPDRCGSCTRCIEACPTDALVAPYKMDATRCIAYLTIEKRGAVPEEFREGIGNNIFGCDICQDVCPWNGRAQGTENVVGKTPRAIPVTRAEEFTAQEELVAPALEWLAKMSREEFNRRFRGTPVKRAKYAGMRRNVAVAMGNSGVRSFSPLLEDLACDEDPMVAEHARWALRKLKVVETT